jgi:hypothetical protein
MKAAAVRRLLAFGSVSISYPVVPSMLYGGSYTVNFGLMYRENKLFLMINNESILQSIDNKRYC